MRIALLGILLFFMVSCDLLGQYFRVTLRCYGTLHDYNRWSSNTVVEYDKEQEFTLPPGEKFPWEWNAEVGDIRLRLSSDSTIDVSRNGLVSVFGKLEFLVDGDVKDSRNLEIRLQEDQKTQIYKAESGKNWASFRIDAEIVRSTSNFQQERIYRVKYEDKPDRNSPVHLGVCRVSIPTRHVKGKMESPSWWKLEFQEKPSEHLMVLDIKSMSEPEFLGRMSHSLGKCSKKDVLVYIHGFQTNFRDAARRAAQLSYDMKFPGIPILYSWPSRGNVLAYTSDAEGVVFSEEHFQNFLQTLSIQKAIEKIHIIAYSMGNRVLVGAMKELCRGGNNALRAKLGQVVMTAPDVNMDIFKRDFPKFQNMAEKFTLYCSAKDKALHLSEGINGFCRMGEVGKNGPVLVLPGMDVIDVSSLDTNFFSHDYHATQSEIISDMADLIATGKSPEDRIALFYEKKTHEKRVYYEMTDQKNARSLKGTKGMTETIPQDEYHIVQLFYCTDRVEQKIK